MVEGSRFVALSWICYPKGCTLAEIHRHAVKATSADVKLVLLSGEWLSKNFTEDMSLISPYIFAEGASIVYRGDATHHELGAYLMREANWDTAKEEHND